VTLRTTQKQGRAGQSTRGRAFVSGKPRTGFEFSLLDEPLLLFADNYGDTSPKRGLAIAGPAGLGSSQHKSQILVGLIGTGQTQEKAKDFLNTCRAPIEGSETNPRQVPAFPGMTRDTAFKTDIEPLESHLGRITNSELQSIVGNSNPAEGFNEAVKMLTGKVQLLCESDSPPDSYRRW
jgi:hypothetical protein